MGAGAVRGQQPEGSGSDCAPCGRGQYCTHRNPSNHSKTEQPASDSMTSMACEACHVNFSLFKRKKTCPECRRPHCSACLVKEAHLPATQRCCSKCHLLSKGNFTRHDLQKLDVKDLKAFLSRKGINTLLCSEKNDFVELVLQFSNSSQYFREQRASQEHTALLEERMRMHDAEQTQSVPQNALQERASGSSSGTQPDGSSGNESEDDRKARMAMRQQEEMAATESRLQEELQPDEVDTRPGRLRATIDELKEVGEISELTVRQLKEILITNYVDYKGCVEKWELVARVRRLWEDNNQSRTTYRESQENVASDPGEEANICKVCMDAVIDCVLLECGHMLTCTKCGRQLSECPICRQYVVRVVHTFRA